MRVFLDVEFTAFRDPKMRALGLPYSPAAKMLSLGMTAAEGDLELYVEITDPEVAAKASEFVRSHVLSQFGVHPAIEAATTAGAGHAVADFLAAIPGQIELCADFDDDLWFVMDALVDAGRMEDVHGRLQLENASRLLSAAGVEGAWDEAFEFLEADGHMQRHHALLDARALKRVYLATLRAGTTPAPQALRRSARP